MPTDTVIDRLLKIHHEERMRTDSVQAPLGSNNVKYNTWYYGSKVSVPKFMWCAVYQSWVAAKCGIPMSIYPKAASVPVVRDFFKAKGRIFDRPLPGDYVLFISVPPSGTSASWRRCRRMANLPRSRAMSATE